MTTRVALIAVLLTVAGCGGPEPAAFDVQITWAVAGGMPTTDGPVTSKEAVTFLAVDKPGRARLVDAWQEGAGDGEVYGRHRFPPHSSAPAVAAYYLGVLINAGWERGVDFEIEEGSPTLRLFGVRHAEAGADGDEIRVALERAKASGSHVP